MHSLDAIVDTSGIDLLSLPGDLAGLPTEEAFGGEELAAELVGMLGPSEGARGGGEELVSDLDDEVMLKKSLIAFILSP